MKNAEDNIKTKEEKNDVENTDGYNNLTMDKNEVSIFNNQLKSENINEINKKEERKDINNKECDENNSKNKNETENIIDNNNIIDIDDDKKDFDNNNLTGNYEINQKI